MRRIGTGKDMKEAYYTRLKLDQQAYELYSAVRGGARNQHLPFQPQESALLVLDMQAYFLAPASHAYIPSAPAIVKGITQLVDAYFALGRPVIFTQHINSASDAGMMFTWWKDGITAENAYRDIIPELDVGKGQVIQKSQYDAFYQTPLEDTLRAAGVRQVVICGVMTHLCCETTARSAFMRGFTVFFPVDGTATYNLDFHRASLTNLVHGFAVVVLVKDILDPLRGLHAG